MIAMMDLVIVGAFVVATVLFMLLKPRNKRIPEQPPYSLTKYLFSNAERSFFGVLLQAVGSTGIVFSKVRVADVIAPRKGLKRPDWQRAFNAISAKHFDFLVCDPNDCAVLLAIELDDSSHNSEQSQARDALIDNACNSAGLPLLRIKAARGYSIAEIQRAVEGLITPSSAQSTETASSAPTLTVLTTTDNQPAVISTTPTNDATSTTKTPPTCPKCQATMVFKAHV